MVRHRSKAGNEKRRKLTRLYWKHVREQKKLLRAASFSRDVGTQGGISCIPF
jgi:hypothetical protein